jgi:hypothetical protein
MKSSLRLLTHYTTLSLLVSLAQAAEPEFRSLFNGKNLAGWSGDTNFWSVRDGAITGRSSVETPLKGNTFIVWQGGQVTNFELHAKFKLVADNDKNFANSGVQYRSRLIDPAHWVVGGYQADMDAGNTYTGMLYEEKGRGILVQPGERIRISGVGPTGKLQLSSMGARLAPTEIKAAIHAGEWNDLVIIAEGNHLRHFVNGKLTAEAIDSDSTKSASTGVLALQLHAGLPMTVQFKEIFLKPLTP